MILYEYICDGCGDIFSVPLPLAERDEPLGNDCVVCGKRRLRRSCGNNGGFRLGTRGSISWAKGGYSSLLGDALKAEGSK